MGLKSWIRHQNKKDGSKNSSEAEIHQLPFARAENVNSAPRDRPALDTQTTHLESADVAKEGPVNRPTVLVSKVTKSGISSRDGGPGKDEFEETRNSSSPEQESGPTASNMASRMPTAAEFRKRKLAPEDSTQTADGPEAFVQRGPPKFTVHALDAARGLGIVCLFFLMALIAIFEPSFSQIVRFTLLAFPMGVAYTWLWSANVGKRQEVAQHLNSTPSLKGLASLLGQQPTWLQYTDKEKVEFLNKVTAKAWPFYDRAVGAAIKEVVEPILQELKPPMLSRIGFSKLTFGDVPLRIEGVCVDRTAEQIVLDMDYRWCGDASIVLAIELTGQSTRLAPKINDLQVVGSVRIILKPLVDVMPGFGALLVTKNRPPKVTFNLDFGKALGGSVVGGGVRYVIYSFMKDIWSSLLVWPNRLVIPILDESVTGPLDHLQLQSVGLLTVVVVGASGLPRADTVGLSDPVVELYTEPKRRAKTTVKKKTLAPRWNEDFYLLVQEPMTQSLFLVVSDVDSINVQGVLRWNIVKGMKESIGAETPIGRATIPVKNAAAQEGREVDSVFDLGPNEFSEDNGPGTGCGQIRLKLMYRSFKSLRPTEATCGALIVTVIRCRNLVAMDRGGTSDPYVKVKVGKKRFKTRTIQTTLNPEYNEMFEFFDPRPGHCISIDDELTVKVFDQDFAGGLMDDFMGRYDLPVSDVALSCGDDGSPGVWRKWFPLEEIDHGEIELQIQFIPFA